MWRSPAARAAAGPRGPAGRRGSARVEAFARSLGDNGSRSVLVPLASAEQEDRRDRDQEEQAREPEQIVVRDRIDVGLDHWVGELQVGGARRRSGGERPDGRIREVNTTRQPFLNRGAVPL